ncbi:MAG: 4Fe-4S dicluster domain-containing protein [Chloroflexi bacterium]|nr:MAG: 4Fe-4S dicluster domain-containing protein [Chloroflexota bacterium]
MGSSVGSGPARSLRDSPRSPSRKRTPRSRGRSANGRWSSIFASATAARSARRPVRPSTSSPRASSGSRSSRSRTRSAATFQTGEGVVLVDQDRCIGCRMCMAACPYGARYFNYNEPPGHQHPFQHPTPEHPVPQQKGTVGKCMFCVHRTEDGKLPACVDACGMGALYIGDLVEDVATNGQQTVRLSQFIRENDAFRYKEELGTGPRVYYIAGHGQLWES